MDVVFGAGRVNYAALIRVLLLFYVGVRLDQVSDFIDFRAYARANDVVAACFVDAYSRQDYAVVFTYSCMEDDYGPALRMEACQHCRSCGRVFIDEACACLHANAGR